jgi:hypothetical protein
MAMLSGLAYKPYTSSVSSKLRQNLLEQEQFSGRFNSGVSGTADDAFANRLVGDNDIVVNKNFEHEAKYGEWQRPMSKVDADPFHFSSISYPRNITTSMQNGHYMLFYVNVQNKTKYGYDAYDAKGKSIRVGDKVIEYRTSDQAIRGGANKTAISHADDPSYVQRLNNISAGGQGNIDTSDGVDLRKGGRSGFGKGTGMSSYRPTTSRITDSVAIYLPPNITNNTGASYQGIEQGALGLAAAGGGKFFDAMRRNDFSAAAGILTGTGGNLIAAGLQKALAGAADLFFDSEGASDLYNKAFGNATNPYMEVFFGGMELRTFSYNFTFAPKNQDETNDVQKIIEIFRFHMAPELQGENMRYLTLPSTFDIHYMYQHSKDIAKENNFYNKIATCVLTNVAVDYAPNGVKSFADGAPTAVTMNLSFTETEILTKERIDQGF